jgi:flagellum-specific ATP synthase
MVLQSVLAEIGDISEYSYYGRVAAIQGLLVEIGGVPHRLSIGSRVQLESRSRADTLCEIVGFRDGRALAMPFGQLEGVGVGCKAHIVEQDPVIYPDSSWLGRVVNAVGEPIDGGPPLRKGTRPYVLRATPPPAHARQRVAGKVDLGVRAMNTFLTCCRGQRMGVFAASGVGKSVLLSMMAKFTSSDVNIIGLVGERGREVQEFLEDYLGPEGRARSIVVVATSDESALMRRQAAHMTLTLAEYFRDRDNDVLCMIDSVTRFAMAQREIGLSGGEPPASKGYTPTVFAELPKLLERAGPGTDAGTITGLFTVLVEGDDHNEPVADAVRGILDGHIVLDRAIAERGRFPAINILRSISRTMPGCNSAAETALVNRARRLMAVYDDVAEMVRLGAYQAGSDPKVDEAIHYNEALEAYLAQKMDERVDLAEGYRQLEAIIGSAGTDGDGAGQDVPLETLMGGEQPGS